MAGGWWVAETLHLPQKNGFGDVTGFSFLSFSSLVHSPPPPNSFFQLQVQVGYIQREQMNVACLVEEGWKINFTSMGRCK